MVHYIGRILNEFEVCRWYVTIPVEYFLRALILNKLNNLRLGKNFLTLTNKIAKCQSIYIFYFNGNDIAMGAEFHYRIIIGEFPMMKFCQSGTWSVGVRVQDGKRYIEVNSGLNKHPTKLAAS